MSGDGDHAPDDREVIASGPRWADEGGDPACWLSQICPECAAFVEDGTSTVCPRCGAVLPAGEEGGSL